MYTLVIILYLFVCVAMVLSILLQSAKGEGLAGAFGGSAMTGTVFGGRGAATFLSKATTILGAAFMILAISIAFIRPTTGTTAIEGGSAVEEAVREGQVPAPQPPSSPTQTPPAGQQQPAQQQQQGQAPDQQVPIEQLFESQQSGDQQQTEGQQAQPATDQQQQQTAPSDS